MQKKLTPLMKYLEKEIDYKIVFKSGYSYQDTIDKFSNGRFDIGFIGPSPYIKSQQQNPDALELLAQLKNNHESESKAIVFSKKGSSIDSIQKLQDKSFAFGSTDSTLSYYVPMNILLENNMAKKLKKYNFLGKHDRVVQYVIMGKYDAGAVKKSVADRYKEYIQYIAQSDDYPEFAIVAQKSLDRELREKIKKALIELKEIAVVKSIQSSAVGFKEVEDADYSQLKTLMQKVDEHTEE
jgi:phosphonate transport system substrate-binding protein